MKSSKKVLAFALAAAMVVTAVPATNAQAAAKTAKLSSKTVTVAVGSAKKQTKSIKVVTPSNWKNVKVKVSSSNKKVATVKATGKTVKVTGVKKGTAKVTVKVTAKKGKKPVKKTLSAKATVINAGLKFTNEAAEVTTGATLDLAVKKSPKAAKLTYTSSDEAVATVKDGVVTGVKAGKATITVTSDYGKTITKEVTVKDTVAQLTAVKQTASNAFVATFSAATPQYTKDDITVKNSDNTEELAVKSVEYAKDGLTATVTLQKNFTDAKTYKIGCKDASFDLTAKVGAVSEVVIKTTQAQKNVATPIDFTLVDKDGIDVTPNTSLDSTCNVTVDGAYSSAEIDKASAAKITMANVGDKASVTITYSTNAKDAQDVTKTQEIVCVNAEAVKGDNSFIVTDKINKNSQSAKFYNTESATETKLAEKEEKTVYFCAKQDEYDAVSYDSYEIESANDSIATAVLTKDAGKFATIKVTGNTAGKTQLNVTAIKNDAKTTYTIPVTVTKVLEATKMTVEVDKSTMSNVEDPDYRATITAKLYDSENNEVTKNGNYAFEITTKDANPNMVKQDLKDSNKATFEAQNVKERVYTVKVTGSDSVNGTGKTFTKSVNIQVKALPNDAHYKYTKKDEVVDGKGVALTYQIEMSDAALDLNSDNDKPKKLTSRLYATYNGLFAGYVRGDGVNDDGTRGITVANGTVKPSTATQLSSVEVAAKFGTEVYGATDGNGNLYNKYYDGNGKVTTGAAVTQFVKITTKGAVTFNASVTATKEDADAEKETAKVDWSQDGKKNVGIAKEGTYTLTYRLYYSKDADKNGKVPEAKAVLKTNIFRVTNSIVKPKVKVVKNALDSIDEKTIREDGLKTNVDMNNEELPTSTSIVRLDETKDLSNGSRLFTKYAVVKDNYGNLTWNFYTTVNATFKTE
ncbi:Ig-like domain-containing protein [Roseburia faecis]|uniref:Ig-like domain-containing protein n=1 Tax=Roseburia faecis TaxID=301302 RepID=UPI003F95B299